MTLRILNDPKYVQILVNPEKRTLAIQTCRRGSVLAHGIVNTDLAYGSAYRIEGIALKAFGAAMVHLEDIRIIKIKDNSWKLMRGWKCNEYGL